MVKYKPDCDSNDCELPNEKATPSISSIEAWLLRLHVGWAITRIPYYLSDSCAWLDIELGRLTVGLRIDESLFSTIDSYIQVDQTCMRARRTYLCNC